MKNTILSIVLVFGFANALQAQFNEYKYIVVPKKFDGFKKENQYKTSTLIKHLFTENGFNAVYDDELPEDLKMNRCLGLFATLDNQSSLFTTKVVIYLKDCREEVVFKTEQGRSREKEYESSFAEAIGNAFGSLSGISYQYEPELKEQNTEPLTVSFKNDVKKVGERPNLDRNQSRMVEQEATEERQYYKDNRPLTSDYKKAGEPIGKVTEQVATEEERRFNSATPETVPVDEVENSSKKSDVAIGNKSVGVLYAQEISNGYQLVDSTPKILMTLLKSSSPNLFLAKSSTINGVVYTEGGKWFFEYYDSNTLVTEELNIKF